MRKIFTAGIVLLILICMVTVSASTGSMDDPLITLSYLDGAFAASLRTDVSASLGNAADNAMNRLDEIYRNYIGYSFTPGYIGISLAAGETVTLASGGSFILLSGAATVAVSSGTVINISTGNEVATGSALTQNRRYFCTENTTMVITAASASTGQLDGYYFTSGQGAVAPQYVFTDVMQRDWFFEAVDYVYRNDLFAGTSATTFSPSMPMTRGMFVTVLHRLDGRPEISGAGGFSDVVNTSLYYYAAVIWASENGIVTGYLDGTFQPDRSVSREEMAAIMHRYAAYKGRDMRAPGEVYDSFPDNNEVSSYAVPPMRWAVSREIIRGSNGRLLPRNTATRAEVAQIIYNYREKVG